MLEDAQIEDADVPSVMQRRFATWHGWVSGTSKNMAAGRNCHKTPAVNVKQVAVHSKVVDHYSDEGCIKVNAHLKDCDVKMILILVYRYGI